MRTNRLIARALVVLGFGGVAGLGGACAHRAQRSGAQSLPTADSVVVRDGDAPVRAMYGVPPARFDPNRPTIERRAPAPNAAPATSAPATPAEQ
jgi:hypothetical protein